MQNILSNRKKTGEEHWDPVVTEGHVSQAQLIINREKTLMGNSFKFKSKAILYSKEKRESNIHEYEIG